MNLCFMRILRVRAYNSGLLLALQNYMRTQKLILWPAAVAAFLMLAASTAIFLPTQAGAASPTITLSSTGSTPFSTLTVSGSGFASGETVQLSMGLSTATAAANGTGSFSSASLTIPNVPSGLYYVIAVGQTSGTVAFSSIWVSSFFANANPSSWYITPGSTLTWSGSSFSPNEVITVQNGSGTTIATFSADASGNFSGAGGSTVPFSARNTVVSYSVHGAQSGTNLSYSLAVADMYPYAGPSSWYALPGTAVTFSGSGFGPNEGVSLYLGTGTTVLGHATANASGGFTLLGPVTLPFGAVANYRLVGDQSGASAAVPVTLASFYPSIAPSAYYSSPGSTITLSGSGFAPNEDVTIKVGTTDKGTAHANSTGAFSGFSLALPSTPNALPVISGTGVSSGAVGSFTMAIGDYYSWINLSTWWAQGGTAQVIAAHNFAGGETVTATANGQTLGTAVANSTGDATINATVPFVIPGPATITVTGGTSGASAAATMTVAQVWTDLQLASYSVPAGQPVHFVGHGYLANEQVEITSDRTSGVQATLTTNATGDLDATWTLPAGLAEGNLTVTAKSLHSFDTKSITFWVAHP